MIRLASIFLVSYLASSAGVIVGCLIGGTLWGLQLPSLADASFYLSAGFELGPIGGMVVGLAAVVAGPKRRSMTIRVGAGIVTVLSAAYFYYWYGVTAAV